MSRKPSAVIDTRVIYCGYNLDQLRKLPGECVYLIYIDPPFNSNRNCRATALGCHHRQAGTPALKSRQTKKKRSVADRHESTEAYIEPTGLYFHRKECCWGETVRKFSTP